jgi:hypothetical protein
VIVAASEIDTTHLEMVSSKLFSYLKVHTSNGVKIMLLNGGVLRPIDGFSPISSSSASGEQFPNR